MWSGVMVNLGTVLVYHLLFFHLVGEWFHGVFETLDSALHVVYVGDVGWVEAFFDQAFHLTWSAVVPNSILIVSFWLWRSLICLL